MRRWVHNGSFPVSGYIYHVPPTLILTRYPDQIIHKAEILYILRRRLKVYFIIRKGVFRLIFILESWIKYAVKFMRKFWAVIGFMGGIYLRQCVKRGKMAFLLKDVRIYHRVVSLILGCFVSRTLKKNQWGTFSLFFLLLYDMKKVQLILFFIRI